MNFTFEELELIRDSLENYHMNMSFSLIPQEQETICKFEILKSRVQVLSNRISEELKQHSENNSKYTVKSFINRLNELPADLEIKGYVFVTDNGNCKNTFEMGKIK